MGQTTVSHTPNESNDVQVLRPLEVLAEEWLKLRAQGVPTPSIAVWPQAFVGCPSGKICMGTKADGFTYATWRWVLDEFYNNPKFEQIVYRPFDADGKKLLMLPTSVAPAYSNESFVSLLEANGGRHDVRVISMWAISAQYWTGVWDFFQFCQAPCGETSVRAPGDVNHSSGPKMCSTTSMVDVPDCNQNPSAGPDGNPATFEITVSCHDIAGTWVAFFQERQRYRCGQANGGYMMAQSSLPFANPGHLRGLTLQRSFKKVLEVGPPHLFMASFNEHTGGRQASAVPANTGILMGLPYDAQNRSVWADTCKLHEPTLAACFQRLSSSCDLLVTFH